MKQQQDTEGVELLSSETNASITRHWMENGQHHSLSEEMEGDSEEVKKWASPRRSGEKIAVRNVHTKQKFAQTIHKNTTDGIQKSRHTWEVQTNDFGDGKGVNKGVTMPTNTESTQHEEKGEEKNNDPSPLAVLKNFVDKIADGQTALWVVVVAIGILAGIALAIAATS